VLEVLASTRPTRCTPKKPESTYGRALARRYDCMPTSRRCRYPARSTPTMTAAYSVLQLIVLLTQTGP